MPLTEVFAAGARILFALGSAVVLFIGSQIAFQLIIPDLSAETALMVPVAIAMPVTVTSFLAYPQAHE